MTNAELFGRKKKDTERKITVSDIFSATPVEQTAESLRQNISSGKLTQAKNRIATGTSLPTSTVIKPTTSKVPQVSNGVTSDRWTTMSGLSNEITSLSNRRQELEQRRSDINRFIAEGTGATQDQLLELDRINTELRDIRDRQKDVNKIRPDYNATVAENKLRVAETAQKTFESHHADMDAYIEKLNADTEELNRKAASLKVVAEQMSKTPTEALKVRYESDLEAFREQVNAYQSEYQEYENLVRLWDDYNTYAEVTRTPFNLKTIGEAAGKVFEAGLAQIGTGFASTLAFGENLTNKALGTESTWARAYADDAKANLERATNAAHASIHNWSNDDSVQALWDIGIDLGASTVAALPYVALMALTFGASAPATAGTLLAPALSRTPGVMASLGLVAQTVAKNPGTWFTMMQSLGSEYEAALENGAPEGTAVLTAVLASAANAGIEVSGGIQSLPGKSGSLGKRLVESAHEEGMEEVWQSLISNIGASAFSAPTSMDEVFSATNPEALINPVELAKNYGAGVAVGLVLSAAQTGGAYGINKARQGGANLIRTYAAGDAIQRSLTQVGSDANVFAEIQKGLLNAPKDSKAHKLAVIADNQRKSKGKVSNLTLGKLAQANNAVTQTDLNEAAAYMDTDPNVRSAATQVVAEATFNRGVVSRGSATELHNAVAAAKSGATTLVQQAEAVQTANPDVDVLDAATTLLMERMNQSQKTALKNAKVINDLLNGVRVEWNRLKTIDPTNRRLQEVMTELTGMTFPENMTQAQMVDVYNTASQAYQAKLHEATMQSAIETLSQGTAVESQVQAEEDFDLTTYEGFAAAAQQANPNITPDEIREQYFNFKSDLDFIEGRLTVNDDGQELTFAQLVDKLRTLEGSEALTDAEARELVMEMFHEKRTETRHSLERQDAERKARDEISEKMRRGELEMMRQYIENALVKSGIIKEVKVLYDIDEVTVDGKRLREDAYITDDGVLVFNGKTLDSANAMYWALGHELTHSAEWNVGHSIVSDIISALEALNSADALSGNLKRLVENKEQELKEREITYKQFVSLTKGADAAAGIDREYVEGEYAADLMRYVFMSEDILGKFAGQKPSIIYLADKLLSKWLITDEKFRAANDIVEDLSNKFQTALRKSEAEVTYRSDFEVETAQGEFVASSNDTGGTKMSLSTYDAEGRQLLRNWMEVAVSKGDLTQEDADSIMTNLEQMYEICSKYKGKYAPFGAWSEAPVVSDAEGNPIFSVIKKNGDYVMNLDFSLVCKKRRTLDAVLNEIIKQGFAEKVSLGQTDIVRINELIRSYGFETACDLCFVDSKRYRQAEVADKFSKMYNKLVNSLIPKGSELYADYFNFGGNSLVDNKGAGIDTLPDSELNFTAIDKILRDQAPKGNSAGSVEYRIAKHLKNTPADRKLTLRGDFISTAGFNVLTRENPEVLKLFNAKKGSGGPKSAVSDVQYLNDILSKRSFNAEAAYSVGGVRVQSFSDYVPRLVFDYLQMFADLSAKKLPAHAYTKEELFVKQFGLTGIKINMSLIPRVVSGGVAVGLDENGNYAWADESFDFDTAVSIQNADGYSRNCGTIAVGVSDGHIRLMMADDRIRMIIPYHKSGLNPAVAKMNHIEAFTDYTNFQNTRRKATGNKLDPKVAADKKLLDAMPNFNERLRELGAEGDPRRVAEEYVRWCEEHDLLPKFDKFAYKQVDGVEVIGDDGKRVVDENYYKLLEDFTVYDGGQYVAQESVTTNFPDENSAFGSMEKLIKRGLEEDAILEAKRDELVPVIAQKISETMAKKPRKRSSVSVDGNKENQHPYSYEALVQKPDMIVTPIPVRAVPTKGKKVKAADIARSVRGRMPKLEGPKSSQNFVDIPDLNARVGVSQASVVHGMSGNKTNSGTMATAEVTYALPDVLRNSVVINELNPRTAADGDFSYVLFGFAERADGRQYLIKSTVNHFADNRSAVRDVEIYDILKGIKARKMEAAQNGATSNDPEVMRSHTDNSAASISNASESTISVAELLEIVKENYPELLPRDVREHFGVETPPQDPNARYSVTPDTTESAIYINDGIGRNGETVNFIDLILDGKKKGETRSHNRLTRKWVGMAKDGKVYGRVRLGDPFEITKQSPEYQDAYIEGTNYDIPGGRSKYYYPVLETEDFRDNPRDLDRGGQYGQYRYSVTDESLTPSQMEADLNALRQERSELEAQIEMAYANNLSDAEVRSLNNRLTKVNADIDTIIAEERRATVLTPVQTILDNLGGYRRSDLESLAEQISDGAWDGYEDLSRPELEDALRETIRGRELSPLEMQSKKYGLYVRPVGDTRYAITPEFEAAYKAKYGKTLTDAQLERRFRNAEKAAEDVEAGKYEALLTDQAWKMYTGRKVAEAQRIGRERLEDLRKQKNQALEDKELAWRMYHERILRKQKSKAQEKLEDTVRRMQESAAWRLGLKDKKYARTVDKFTKKLKLKRNAALAILRDSKKLEAKRKEIETEQGPISLIRNNPRERTRLERLQEAAQVLRTLGRSAYRNFTNIAQEIDNFSKRQVSDLRAGTLVNIVGGTSSAVERIFKTGLVDKWGNRIGASMKDVFLCMDGRYVDEAMQNTLNVYLLNRHTVDRMSIKQRAMDRLAAFEEANPDLRDMDQKDFALLVSMTAKEVEKAGNDSDYARALQYARLIRAALKAENKSVYGDNNGNPVTAESAQAICDKLLEENPWLAEKASAIDEWWDLFMRTWAVGDSITEVEYETMREMYPHYVPTYHVNKGIGAVVSVSNTAARVGKAVNKAVGSTKPLSDIKNIEDSFSELVAKIVKLNRTNELYRNILDTLMLDNDGNFADFGVFDWNWQEGDYGKILSVDEMLNGDIDSKVDEQIKIGLTKDGRDYKLAAWYNGQLYSATVSKDLYRSVAGVTGYLENDVEKTIIKVGNMLTGPMKTFLTGINPIFATRNVSRDIPTAIVNSISGAKFLKYYKDAAAHIARNSDEWQQFQALGGTHAGYYNNNKGFADSMTARRGVLGTVKDTLEVVNNVTESQTRFAEYLATIDKLGDTYESRLQGIKNSAEVTVDFSRRGRYGKMINAWVAYWNPAVQGIDKTIRSVIQSPDGSAIWKQAMRTLGRGAMVTILPEAILFAIRAAFDRDDEWEQLDDRTKDTYYCIPLKDEHKFLKIPKTREWGAIIGTPFMRILEYANGRDNPFENYIETAISPNFLPPGIKDIIVVDQIVSLESNKDFAGRDIVPYAYQDVAPENQWNEETSALARALGGLLKFSPMQIDYLLTDYFGDLGETLIGASDMVVGALGSDLTLRAVTPEDLIDVLFGSFIGDNRYNNANVSKYYDTMDALAQVVNDKKNRMTSEQYQSSIEYKTQSAINKLYGNKISALNKEVRGLPDGEEKDDLKAEILALATEALEFYEQSMAGEIREPVLTANYAEYSKQVADELIRMDDYSSDYSFKPYTTPSSTYTDPDDDTREYILDAEQKDYCEQLYIQLYDEMFADLFNSTEYRGSSNKERAALMAEKRKEVRSETTEQFLEWLKRSGARSTKKVK